MAARQSVTYGKARGLPGGHDPAQTGVRMKRNTLLALLALGLAPTPALAQCHWEWFCNGDGACKQMPLCDSVNETPPPRPDTQPPAMPPIAMRPYRIAGPMGALTCEHIMRKLGSGKWHWVE